MANRTEPTGHDSRQHAMSNESIMALARGSFAESGAEAATTNESHDSQPESGHAAESPRSRSLIPDEVSSDTEGEDSVLADDVEGGGDYADADQGEDTDDEIRRLRRKRPYTPKQGVEIFVGGLTRSTRRDMLRDWFQHIGEITEVRIARDKRRRRCRGYGYVRFRTSQEANEAIRTMHRFQFKEDRFLGVLPSDENRTLFVGNLKEEWSKELIEKMLRDKLPNVRKVEPIPDKEDASKIRAFCFVEFESHDQAEEIFKQYHRETPEATPPLAQTLAALRQAAECPISPEGPTPADTPDAHGDPPTLAMPPSATGGQSTAKDGAATAVTATATAGPQPAGQGSQAAGAQGADVEALAVGLGQVSVSCGDKSDGVQDEDHSTPGGSVGSVGSPAKPVFELDGVPLKIDWADPLRYHIHLNGGIKGPPLPAPEPTTSTRPAPGWSGQHYGHDRRPAYGGGRGGRFGHHNNFRPPQHSPARMGMAMGMAPGMAPGMIPVLLSPSHPHYQVAMPGWARSPLPPHPYGPQFFASTLDPRDNAGQAHRMHNSYESPEQDGGYRDGFHRVGARPHSAAQGRHDGMGHMTYLIPSAAPGYMPIYPTPAPEMQSPLSMVTMVSAAPMTEAQLASIQQIMQHPSQQAVPMPVYPHSGLVLAPQQQQPRQYMGGVQDMSKHMISQHMLAPAPGPAPLHDPYGTHGGAFAERNERGLRAQRSDGRGMGHPGTPPSPRLNAAAPPAYYGYQDSSVQGQQIYVDRGGDDYSYNSNNNIYSQREKAYNGGTGGGHPYSMSHYHPPGGLGGSQGGRSMDGSARSSPVPVHNVAEYDYGHRAQQQQAGVGAGYGASFQPSETSQLVEHERRKSSPLADVSLAGIDVAGAYPAHLQQDIWSQHASPRSSLDFGSKGGFSGGGHRGSFTGSIGSGEGILGQSMHDDYGVEEGSGRGVYR